MISHLNSAGNGKGVKLGGTLSGIIKESRLTKNDLLDVFSAADVVPADTSSRQAVVRTGLAGATDKQAFGIAATLTQLLKNDGLFDSTVAAKVASVAQLRTCLDSIGASIGEGGEITWTAAAPGPTPTVPVGQPAGVLGPFVPSLVNVQPLVDPAPEPMLTRNRSLERTVEDIVILLERLPFASHSLTRKRRKERLLLSVTDEYDVQDFVFMALRLLYNSVVDEQPSGKKGGDGFNKGDFYLEDHKIMVEAKVAKQGHGVKEIKKEIAVDQAAYRADPSVRALVVVIYDLDYAIADKDALKKYLEEDPKTSVVLKDWFRSEQEAAQQQGTEIEAPSAVVGEPPA